MAENVTSCSERPYHNVMYFSRCKNKCFNKRRGWWVLMNWELGLLFHLLGVVFNLISSLDDLIWSTVDLEWDDPLKVLDGAQQGNRGRVSAAHSQTNFHTTMHSDALVRCFSDHMALQQMSARTQVQVRRTHVSIIWVWWRFLPWGCFTFCTRNLSCFNDKLCGGYGDIYL